MFNIIATTTRTLTHSSLRQWPHSLEPSLPHGNPPLLARSLSRQPSSHSRSDHRPLCHGKPPSRLLTTGAVPFNLTSPHFSVLSITVTRSQNPCINIQTTKEVAMPG
ncbi:hypothetical protein PIB30_049361 [Stylosanthes scabra]|uniref:Uncharacterized protein n=1 Tax=Stylosanthes scabra TaxID=79078 RepID=A0ABU6SH51_9FABA|nr:hypothetical protein [Stylosanthes scabra]